MVHLAHEGHQGIVSTKQRLKDLSCWPKMDALVKSVMASCVSCQLNEKTTRTAPSLVTSVPLPEGPWQKLTLALCPYHGYHGYHYHGGLLFKMAKGVFDSTVH